MKEIWKDIIGYECYYQIANYGNIKSLDRWVKGKNNTVRLIKGRILKPQKDKYGYLTIPLYKEGKIKRFLVHRLVAEAFLPNSDNLPLINHKDENKTNNIVSNLEWCDSKYNNSYGTARERMSEKLSKPVLQYTLDGQFVKEYPSAREAERNGYYQSSVSKCCLGKQKFHKGFIWKYKK